MSTKIYSAGLLALALTACTVIERPVPTAEVTREVIVERTPPALRVETQTVSPGERYVWTRGYWRWTGTEYVWVPGRWVVRPRPAAVWVEGRWVRRPTGWVWMPGHWE